MFKGSAMYPNSAGATFDHDDYRERHMPMVAERLGAALRRGTVDKGLGGGAPGSPPRRGLARAGGRSSREPSRVDGQRSVGHSRDGSFGLDLTRQFDQHFIIIWRGISAH